MTQVMLSEFELQDKGKGPYTEISTLLSEYLVIQVQENINCGACPYSLDYLLLSALIINYIHVLLV